MFSILLFQIPIPQSGPLRQLIDQFSAFFPKLVGALVVLTLGWLIARLVRKVLTQVLSRIGVDRLAEMLNEIDIVRSSGMTIKISSVLAKIVYFVMMLIFVVAATDAMGVEAITTLVTNALNYIPSLFSAAVIFLFGLIGADMVRGLVLTICQSIGLPSAKMVASAVFYFLLITVAVSALSQAQIDTNFISSNLTVIIGAVALSFAFGYGLAARDLMSNYLAGYYNKNKVRIGDDVQILGTRGKVVTLDATSFVLQTDDRAVIVPLNKLISEKVEVFYPDPQEKDLLEEGTPS